MWLTSVMMKAMLVIMRMNCFEPFAPFLQFNVYNFLLLLNQFGYSGGGGYKTKVQLFLD